MRAGKLDRTIVLERATNAVDAFGTVTQTWATLATMRAERVENGVADEVGASGSSTDLTALFRTRFVDGLTLEDRVSFEGRAWTIKHVGEIGRRRGLEIKVERVGP